MVRGSSECLGARIIQVISIKDVWNTYLSLYARRSLVVFTVFVVKSRLVRVKALSLVSKAYAISGFSVVNDFDCIAKD